jgi:hypothetical protein
MSRPIRTLVLVAIMAPAAAQDAAADRVDPVQLVSRAEPMFVKGELEDAVLLLWQALDELGRLPDNPVHEVAKLTAFHLLRHHDPREEPRRRAFESIARQQIDLAQAYRARKWFDTAALRLDIAARYDRNQAAKARAALEVARAKAAPKPTVATTPKVEVPQQPSLLQRESALHVFGDWSVGESSLISKAQVATDPLAMWVTKTSHTDNEIVVEWKPLDAGAPHNCSILFGGVVAASVDGFRADCIFDATAKAYFLRISNRTLDLPDLGTAWVRPPSAADGFRRLSLRIAGNHLQLQLDGETPVQADSSEPVRGLVGLCIGINTAPTCAIEFRTLRVDPLPADMPSDEQLREQRLAKLQQSITGAVEAARLLQEQKQPEPAAQLLRQALIDLDDLPPGLLRDNLAKAIQQMIAQSDPLAARRKKVAQGIAAELVGLADQYAEVDMVRAAQVLVVDAARFDPEATAARLAAADEAVRVWNLAQTIARAADLAPPADDGTLLREWFATGRPLDSRSVGWKVDGASARVEQLPRGEFTALMPKPGLPQLQQAFVHVRLGVVGASAGFCFDAAGPHDYAIAFLRRDHRGLTLHAYRWAAGKWADLKRLRITMDAWRLDAWHEVALLRTPQGLTVRAAGAELKLEGPLLHNGNDRYGLYAGSDAEQPIVIEMRGFRLGP